MTKNLKNRTIYLFLTTLFLLAASTISVSAQVRVTTGRRITEPSKQQPLKIEKTTGRTPLLPQKIIEVIATPAYTSAKISVLIRNPAKVRVEVGIRKPVGSGFDPRFLVSSQMIQAKGSQQASLVNIPNLKPGQHYFYVITVYNSEGGRDGVYFGEFFTRQSVRID